MSKQRRDEGEGAGAAREEDVPDRILGPGKRSGTAGAPSGPPPATPGKRSLTQHFAPRANRSPAPDLVQAKGGAKPSVDDVATRAVENKGSGAPLDGGVRATMEAHLGADFSGVRVHTDEHAAQSAKAMGARAFAHGKDIYLGPNERPDDLNLMAHELTHVAQQAGGVARAQLKVEVGAAGSPAEQQADAVAKAVVSGEQPPMLVEVGAPVVAGQMTVDQFLTALRAQVADAASAQFGPLWSIAGCHYIDKYFAHYAGRSAKEIERAMRLYAPEAAASGNAQAAIGGVTARVRAGMASWKATGELPADAAAIAPPEARGDANEAQAAPAGAAQAMHTCTVHCKHAPGEIPGETNPVAALGEGAPLGSDVASRMGDALGADVSSARVHTGDAAAQLARDEGGLAVTVGQDIAFGAGAYRPGSLEGDALLAHELAHTVQQQGADPTAKVGGESAAAELDADDAAIGAVAQLHGGAEGATFGAALSNIMTTGLQLQRCSPDNSKSVPTVAPPSATSGSKDLFDGTKAPDDKQKAEIDKILNPTGAGGAASKPYKAANFKADMKKAVDGWRKSTTTNFKPLSGPDAFKLDMPQVRKTGEAAQQVVTDKYGDFIKGASAGAGASDAAKPGYNVGDPAVLHTQEESIDPLPKSDQEDMVVGLVSYAMQQPDGGQQVTVDHNVDLSRGPDKTDYYTFMNDYAKTHFAELKKIQQDWPGEEHPWDGTVYIQIRREKDKGLAAKEKTDAKFKDANMRLGYWSTFQTLIHEFLHAAAHGNWRAIENAAPASQRHIMVEGACEFFTEQAYKEIEPKIPGDDALREQVEGKKYPWTPEVLPPWHGYDSRKDVEAMVAAMGGNEQNLRAAYFMGHVELVGLGTWKKEMNSEGGNYEVVVDNFFLSVISERTFVSVADIQKANGFPSTQDKVKKGSIQVPGISHHHVVDGDTKKTIADQHGVTEAALEKANPLITNWARIRTGERLLIPAH